MTRSNINYNTNSGVRHLGKAPFAEAGTGIENIFHLLSIEYYRRLNDLEYTGTKKDGINMGFAFVF